MPPTILFALFATPHLQADDADVVVGLPVVESVVCVPMLVVGTLGTVEDPGTLQEVPPRLLLMKSRFSVTLE